MLQIHMSASDTTQTENNTNKKLKNSSRMCATVRMPGCFHSCYNATDENINKEAQTEPVTKRRVALKLRTDATYEEIPAAQLIRSPLQDGNSVRMRGSTRIDRYRANSSVSDSVSKLI